MDDRTRNILFAIVGTALLVVSIFSIPLLVYMEFTLKGSVSTQLAGLLAIPLAAGTAILKSALVSAAKDKAVQAVEDTDTGGN